MVRRIIWLRNASPMTCWDNSWVLPSLAEKGLTGCAGVDWSKNFHAFGIFHYLWKGSVFHKKMESSICMDLDVLGPRLVQRLRMPSTPWMCSALSEYRNRSAPVPGHLTKVVQHDAVLVSLTTFLHPNFSSIRIMTDGTTSSVFFET